MVWGSGIKVMGSGVRVQVFGLKVWGEDLLSVVVSEISTFSITWGSRFEGLGFRIQSLGFWVDCLWFRV